ncbi:RNA recognition motif containing protein [Musa troglodytarum]|uniref:RNA recognition motif containing protein n=1 Tax=Musa troglodytarum TaxID=320322 RepID=A0A9E7ENZ6_9LILI|nr:RNA recognition motif containing protein [Musa troglodytarum]
MAAIESTSGVDLEATGSPSTGGGGGRARGPRSPKDLASACDAAGLPVLCSCPDGSVDFRSEPLLDRGPARDRAAAVSASAAQRPNGVVYGGERFKREMMDLEELLSRLNPMAEEFVSPSLSGQGNGCGDGGFYANGFGVSNQVRNGRMRKKNGYGDGKQRRIDSRTSLAQRDEVIRRTVYVSDIDHRVTEEQLTTLFINCRQVVDCRMHGDPKSVLCFAFIEFTDEEGARAALNLSGTVLGFYPVIVLPSRTAIAPVNPTFLPRSDDECEMCSRTVYCTNIDKKVSQADVKLFFESICGEDSHEQLIELRQFSSIPCVIALIIPASAHRDFLGNQESEKDHLNDLAM